MTAPAEASPHLVEGRYALLSHDVSWVDSDGAIWLHPSRCKDVARQLSCTKNMILVSPVRPLRDGQTLEKLHVPVGHALSLEPLPEDIYAGFRLLFNVPLIVRLGRIIARCDLSQPDSVAWPTAWLWALISLTLRKRLVIVVESSPWRRPKTASLKSRVRSEVVEIIVRGFVRRAWRVFYTQPTYMASLPPKQPERGVVSPASWIDEDDLLSIDHAEQMWARKLGQRKRFLFASRLSESKGIGTLLEAARLLAERRVDIRIDIMGAGPELAKCYEARDRSEQEKWTTTLTVLEPVPYGEAFFSHVANAHAILVPLLSDEQPRVVFDGFAKAIPCIASATDGIRPHVKPAVTGILVPPSNPEALADAIQHAANNCDSLRSMGLNGLEYSSQITHQRMHEVRRDTLVAAAADDSG